MVRIRRFGVVRTSNIVALWTFVVGLIFLIPFAIIIAAAGNMTTTDQFGRSVSINAGGAIIAFLIGIILYAGFLWVFTAIGLLIYNLVAGFTGGIEVEVERQPAPMAAPGYGPPGYAPPGYGAPPGYAPPGYGPPGSTPPGYGPPGSTPPASGQAPGGGWTGYASATGSAVPPAAPPAEPPRAEPPPAPSWTADDTRAMPQEQSAPDRPPTTWPRPDTGEARPDEERREDRP
jgi:hypothetical protein